MYVIQLLTRPELSSREKKEKLIYIILQFELIFCHAVLLIYLILTNLKIR